MTTEASRRSAVPAGEKNPGRDGWQGDSDTEALDQDHFVLVVYAGGARRIAR